MVAFHKNFKLFSKKEQATVTNVDQDGNNAASRATSHDVEKEMQTPHMAEQPENRAEAILKDVQDKTTEDEGEDESQYPRALKLFFIVLALCLAVFCMALDNTIIATAIPRITDQFNSPDDVAWYGSAYLLTTCALQLFFGKLYTFFSIKYIFLAAIFIFEIGSVVCGAAPSSVALIIGRAIAGIGAAGIFSGAVLILAHSVPLRKRPIYTGLIAGMYGIASVAGPLMGGAFTDHVTWRWCFYINLPFGAITIAFIAFMFKSPPLHKDAKSLTWRQKAAKMDFEGTAVFIPAIVCLLLALQWGGSKYPWHDGRVIALFVIAGVLLIAFVAIQFWKGDLATVPPRVLKQRSVAAAAWFIICLGSSFFVLVYYVPIFFQAALGVSPVNSGVRIIPMVLSLTVFSILSGGLTTKFGYFTPFVILSCVLMSVGAGLISTWGSDVRAGHWIGYQVIYGAGVGMGIQMPIIAVQAVLPLKDIPTGTAIIMFCQTLGGALFVAVGQNIFANQLIKNALVYAPQVPSYVFISTGVTSIRQVVKPEELAGVIQSYTKALDQTFYVSVAMAALGIFGALLLEWRSVKGKKLEMAGA